MDQATLCEYCGPKCYRGAEHNARVEDNARYTDEIPAPPSPEIRYLLRNWHHVTCAGFYGRACTCRTQREKLIAEMAEREQAAHAEPHNPTVCATPHKPVSDATGWADN